MRDFSKVSPLIWESDRFRGLPDDTSRLCHMYLLSNGHQNSIGCYRLPLAYACADLAWDADKYRGALKTLATADLVLADPQTHEILIKRWFRHNGPTNHKHALGAFRLVEKIESVALRRHVDAELTAAWLRWDRDHAAAGQTVPASIRDALADLMERRRVRAA